MKCKRKIIVCFAAWLWLCAAVIPVGAAEKGEKAVIADSFSQETAEGQDEETNAADENGTGDSGEDKKDGDSGEEEKEQSNQPEANTPEGNLLIDDKHIYKDMKRSYQEGYEPEIKDGNAVLILPLYTDGGGKIDSVQAVLDLGSTENSPFVYRNYKKTFAMTEETVEGSSDKMSVFLVRFDLELQEQRLNGVYPVAVSVSYKMDGTACEQSFTIYVQIRDGKSGEETEQGAVVENTAAPETEEIPSSEPKVIIDACEDMPEQIFSGDTVAVRVILRNTNAKKYVQNMIVTVSSETEALSLLSDSDTCYFEKLAAEETLELPLSFRVNENAAAGDYLISLEMTYDNPDAETFTASGKVRIHVLQKTELVLEIGDYASEVQAGDSISVPLQAMNLGRGAVYNVRCQINVPGLTADKSLFLGNLEGGSAASGNLEVFAGMVQPEAETDEERYGKTGGYILVTYEDEGGNEYTQEEELSITINPLVIQTTQEEEEPSVRIQLLIGAAVLLLAAGLGVIVPGIIRRRKTGEMHE